MKLWLVSQTENCNYDTYDSCVVAEETEEAARYTHPEPELAWSAASGLWVYSDALGSPEERVPFGDCWTTPHNVSVKLIGKAKPGTEPGVILASFNAG